MSWFQLDPESIARRIQETGSSPILPSPAASAIRGVLGFTVVSVAGFAPWAIGGRFFYRWVGETGMYLACAFVFIGLSGLLLHRLILGPGSLGRFYRVFGVAFTAYSVAWIAGWRALGGHPGSVVGLLAGAAAMGWALCRAFGSNRSLFRVIVMLFVLNALGYFLGGWVEESVAGWKGMSLLGRQLARNDRRTLAMLLWGVCYGIGLGAGLGLAFHECQAQARALLRSSGVDNCAS